MPKRKNSQKYYRIIEAATRIFAEKGFFQAKVSDIAREAGVADGTIYIYFENKDDILISLFEEQIKVVLDNMIRDVSGEKGPIEKLRRFALTHLELIEKNKSMAEIIHVELRQSSKFVKEYKNENFARYLDILADIVREGQEQGVFRRDVIPGVAKRAIFGALDEMSRFWVLSSKREYDIKTAAEQISSYFIEGMSEKSAEGGALKTGS
ncbi:MAG: TetR/AcrR family transcriptional regulator [Deltaproteobacteria bacterium]|nr:TetR/AcrR family transcriptional regulator [Deltaproteobacteria bacterium]MBW1948724.1 TetR/AcrR family transcriptional regulator [Deltaproteobacteria bacterium]MBW2346863.1 TetR/AcrR family transcriptional regulator [Deltaproteobacteria bacterium]RLB40333.1 MAG: TetR family transcriptional regulator [Deltaproteobacteria bacterium]